VVSADRAVEAFTWLTTGQAAGTAAGAAAVGALAQAGAVAGLGLVAAAPAAAAAIACARRRSLGADLGPRLTQGIAGPGGCPRE
jgi:hypothetical protein